METPLLWPYQRPAAHVRVSEIIRNHSTNTADLREVALRGLDLSTASDILDLGCGFGLLTGPLAARAAPNACFIGVDAWESNKVPYLQTIIDAGRTGRFKCMKIGSRLPWPDASFDVVVSAYSLYFFVEALPEIARVLRPRGLFLTIAHSELHVTGQLPEAGFADGAERLLSLIRKFSAENGEAILSRWFGEVRRVDYLNSLRFDRDHEDELFAYLKFKMPFLVQGAGPNDALPERLVRFVREALARQGEMMIGKDDAIFHCRSPQWP
jgi:SAM-dependent methyltransferase